MSCILVYLTARLGVSFCAKSRSQSWGFWPSSNKQLTDKRGEQGKKRGGILTQLPGCLGDHRGGHPSVDWHLKLCPQSKLLSSRGGGGSPPGSANQVGKEFPHIQAEGMP